MITYRRLTAADTEPMADFAIEGMESMPHPGLRVSREKVLAAIRHFSGSSGDFHMAAFAEGRIVGAIAACVAEMPFFERSEAIVVMCQARGVPGVGSELIKRLMAWAREEFRVRRIQFPEEFGARAGFARLLRRHGFNQVQRVCIHTK